ncbi:MAG: DUF1648 domain-containing protein [Terracidiphilus sp.]
MRRTLISLGWFTFALNAWITYRAVWGPDALPERIPTHFDAAGNANGWGSPAMLLLLPVIGAGVYLAMGVVARFPGAFNYPVQVRPEFRERAQELTLEMIAWLRAELACLFLVLQWMIIEAARSGQGKAFPLVMPPFLVVVLGTIGWFVLALVRLGTPRK